MIILHPKMLPKEKDKNYWSYSDCFSGDLFNLIHCYMHNNYNQKMHSHQFYELNVVLSGSGWHYIGDAVLPTCAGDIFVIPPEVSHGYYSEEALDIYHLLIKTEFIQRYQEELSHIPGFDILFNIEPYIRRFSGKGCNLNVNSKALMRLKEDLERIRSAEKERLFVYENTLSLALICKISALLMDSIKSNSASSEKDFELVQIMEYINANLDSKLTLDILCNVSNMSKATLNRHFRKALNSSPMQYVCETRLTKARELLSQGVLSKTEIAALCGFYDVAHMNKYL